MGYLIQFERQQVSDFQFELEVFRWQSPLTLPPRWPPLRAFPRLPPRIRPATRRSSPPIICKLPPPDEMIAIGDTHTLRQDGRWRILTPRYRPGDTLRDHLDFALRHEAIDCDPQCAVPHHAAGRHRGMDQVGADRSACKAHLVSYEWLTGKGSICPTRPRPLTLESSTKSASSLGRARPSPATASAITCRARRIFAR